MTVGEAQIYDRGYRRYDGPRTGIAGSLRTLVKHSLRHALGLGRSARYKIVPVAVVVMAYLPAAVFIGLAALIPVDTEDFLPTYASPRSPRSPSANNAGPPPVHSRCNPTCRVHMRRVPVDVRLISASHRALLACT